MFIYRLLYTVYCKQLEDKNMSENQEEIYLGETIAVEEIQNAVTTLEKSMNDVSIELLWNGRFWFLRLYFWDD